MSLHIGDARDILPTLPAESVQMCVTSPPYWNLRDYGTAEWEGGDAGCDHLAPARSSTIITGSAGNKTGPNQTAPFGSQYRETCGKCGARRIDKQLGLEPTPEEYVANMVQVFREVRRVLRDDGTLWLNLGDSYNAYNANRGASKSISGAVDESRPTFVSGSARSPGQRRQNDYDDIRLSGRGETRQADQAICQLESGLVAPSLKQKDLVGIPWRVAFALQADGWFLRQDIIWSKPNPMPESVRDRCTKAHEYIFLLSKSARYYFDADAIAEPAAYVVPADRLPSGDYSIGSGRNDSGQHRSGGFVTPDTRNKRSVWTVTTQPYSEAHFATFPPKLIEPCILAGSKPGDVVLDPFFGSGTVGQVCEQLGRKWLGCELNPSYAEMSGRRTAQQGLVLA